MVAMVQLEAILRHRRWQVYVIANVEHLRARRPSEDDEGHIQVREKGGGLLCKNFEAALPLLATAVHRNAPLRRGKGRMRKRGRQKVAGAMTSLLTPDTPESSAELLPSTCSMTTS